MILNYFQLATWGDSVMPDIRASAEVRRLIGAETLGRLEAGAFSSYRCVKCGKFSRTAQPTTVVVLRYRGAKAEVELAHADCADSEIVEVDADPPDRSRADMGMVTLALGYQDKPTMRPLLVLEPRTETIGPTQGEERVTVPVAALLRYGLTLMTSGSQLPDLAEDWQLHRPDQSSARLVETRGSVVYSGPCDQPDGWARLVDSVGACVVLIGTIGLYAAPDGELTEDRIRQMLGEAAHVGLLAGGIVICADSPVAGLSRAEQPGELRRRIAQSWHRQA
jgi:hypothetical protein